RVLALTYLVLQSVSPLLRFKITHTSEAYIFMTIALALMLFENQILEGLRSVWPLRTRTQRRAERTRQQLQQIKVDKKSTLGVVYMSGDDLSYHKLTSTLLIERWQILRDKLDSEGIRLLFDIAERPDDSTLQTWFEALYEAESKFGVTVWHPTQLGVTGEMPQFPHELGLNIYLENAEQRR